MEAVVNFERSPADMLLADIRRLVRFGQQHDIPTLKQWKVEVGSKIQRLEKICDKSPLILDPAENIQFITLRAEYHDILGQDKEAASLLARYVLLASGSLDQQIMNIPGMPPRLNPKELDTERQHARWIRQIAWL